MKQRWLVVSFVFASFLFVFLSEETKASMRNDVVTKAKQYIGVPYQWAGTTPSGFDCSGYIHYVFDKFGMNMPRTTSAMYNVGEKVSKSNLQKGDLVFFNTSGKGVTHAGIYIGNGKFIHASTSKGVIESSLDDPYYWGPRYIGAKRVIEEEKEQKSELLEAKEETLPSLPAGEYHDVPANHWAYEEVKSLGEQGIVSGYPESMFKPGDAITRAEVAAAIVKQLGLEASEGDERYADVPADYWASEAIHAATEAGILTGYGDDTFKPDATMKRSEVAAVLKRAFQLEEVEEKDDVMSEFTDIDEEYWAYEDIASLVANEVTTGYSDKTFRPEEHTKRAEFVVFLYRLIN